MDLKLLSHKVTMLIALTSAARASELQALTTADMIDTGIKLTLTLDTLSKTSKVGELSLPWKYMSTYQIVTWTRLVAYAPTWNT